MIDLRSCIVAFVVDAHRAGIVEHLGGFVAQLGLVQKLLHITQTIRPAVVAFASEGAVIRDFCALVEEEGSAFIATTSAASSRVALTTAGLLPALAALPGFTWFPARAFFASGTFLALALRPRGAFSGL
jgi:hypothetical protein